MPRFFIHGRRGVSEIIGSLIIILIVTVAGSGLYAYSLSEFYSSGSSFLLKTSGREERALERLCVTAVWWNISNDFLNLTVLNYGKIELTIDAVYIDGRRVEDSAYNSGRGEFVAVGNLLYVKFTSPIPIVENQSYKIIAVSERGSRDEFYWKA